MGKDADFILICKEFRIYMYKYSRKMNEYLRVALQLSLLSRIRCCFSLGSWKGCKKSVFRSPVV